MNEHNHSSVKNFVMIMTGIVVSLAGIVYIAVQYSKLLTALFMKNEEGEDDGRFDEKLKSSLRQVKTEEGSDPNETDETDLSIDLDEE